MNAGPLFESAAVYADLNANGRLDQYISLLLKENQRQNLVSRETSADDLKRLVVESIIPMQLVGLSTAGHYLDIGSGGGLPALPILLAYPAQSAVLIDRSEKKLAALRRMALALFVDTPSVRLVQLNTDEQAPEGSFDLITVRLVRLSPALLSTLLGCLARDGRLIYYAEPDFPLDTATGTTRHQYLLAQGGSKPPVHRSVTIFTQ